VNGDTSSRRSTQGELSRPADAEPSPAAGGVVSPYVTALPVRISAGVFPATDPAAALAARFLLRVAKSTRPVYASALTEWFTFARRLGVEPLQAKIDHADAYAPGAARAADQERPAAGAGDGAAQAVDLLEFLSLRRRDPGPVRVTVPRRQRSADQRGDRRRRRPARL
jgi:hypothetical protein